MTPNTKILYTDILIVGAGPTGLLLANLLGTMGISTIVVEKNSHTAREPRAVSIDDESMRSLQTIGLAEEITKILTRGYGSIYKGPSGHVFSTVKPTSKEFGFDKRNAFQQPELEAVLLNGLNRFKKVDVIFNAELTKFSQTNEEVISNIKTNKQKDFQIQSKYMVGCDGGQSFTRKSLNIDMLGSSFEEPWLIIDLKTTKNRSFHTEVFCNPRRSCITLPGPNGIRRYEFKLNLKEDPDSAMKEENVRTLLSSVGPDEHEEFRRVKVYTFHARLAESWRVKRVLLAGDAAHLTPPFAGQGMNSGLRDSYNLAWKLNMKLNGSTGEEILDSYELERKPHAASMIKLAKQMGQIMMPTSQLQGALVRGAFYALGIYPPARDYFSQMRYKPKPRFKEGLIWPDRKTPKYSVIGQMIVQPIVETVFRERVLLDDVLPTGLALLVISKNPDHVISSCTIENCRQKNIPIIGITPEWINPQKSSFEIVRDVSNFFGKKPLVEYLEHTLLLRPDRYVAASQKVENTDKLLEVVKSLQE